VFEASNQVTTVHRSIIVIQTFGINDIDREKHAQDVSGRAYFLSTGIHRAWKSIEQIKPRCPKCKAI
jgi:hypothetical protein